VTSQGRGQLLGGLFDRGAPGAGAAVTSAARVDGLDLGELARLAVGEGNPVPALVRALTARASAEGPQRP
jgi:hypothetical protein